jgi:hypothetical protein
VACEVWSADHQLDVCLTKFTMVLRSEMWGSENKCYCRGQSILVCLPSSGCQRLHCEAN